MKIKIKNFRSFKDMEYIDIKPITVLIGKNSAGKSSFLRTFPMLKQSLEERTKSPVLLYGNYVDFGSYKDIKPYFNDNENDNYELGFIFNHNIFSEINRNIRNRFYRYKKYLTEDYFDIKFQIMFEEDKKNLLHIKELFFELRKNKITLKLNYLKRQIESITINNEEIVTVEDNFSFIDRGDFNIDIFRTDEKNSIIYGRESSLKDFIEDKIINMISQYTHGRTEYSTKISIFQDIIISSDRKILNQLKKEYPTKWYQNISHWDTNHTDFKKLRNLLVLFNLFDNMMSPIISYFRATFLNVRYIAPLRATAERYYRIQHLAVNEVDPNGTNLPFFLDSLTDRQTSDFQDWTRENFGFIVKITKIEGHYSIKISHNEGIETNLSDMGFGYSQILPILTQLWYSSSKYDRSRRTHLTAQVEKIIVIEQPELHLHPEFQAKFTDMLTKVIKNAQIYEISLKIIIETHSDVIINRLGDSILDNDINANDINIVIFDKLAENEPTTISFAKYDENSNLIDWPLGFFQPSIRN